MSAREPKSKLVIFHSPSLFGMMRANGIGVADYGKLLNISVECVGACKTCVGDPLMIAVPSINPERKRAMCDAGFEVVIPGVQVGQHIHDIIAQQDFSVVGELVIVSCSFYHTTSILLEKARSGIPVYILGTRTSDPKGEVILPDEINTACDALPNFYFVEIAQFKDAIMVEEWRDWPRPAVSPPPMESKDSSMTLTFTFHVPRGANVDRTKAFLNKKLLEFVEGVGILNYGVNLKEEK